MFALALILMFASGEQMDLNVTQAAQSVVLLHSKLANGNDLIGTGFLVQLPGQLFLVTAEHVAREIGPTPQLTFGAVGDVARTLSLRDVAGSSPLGWVFHGEADVAVLALRGTADVVGLLSKRALQPAHLVNVLEAPNRERVLTTVGFPLGLGGLTLGPDQRISPLTRESRAASGLLTLARFDTKKPTTFFVLDNPSIGGFSGAPVFMLPGTVVSHDSLGFTPPVGFCLGLVHGTIGDGTGGKLAAIVPVAYITQTLEKAFKP